MEERRSESRLLCADIVFVCWADPAGRTRRANALLEDISVHGAGLLIEIDLPPGTEVALEHAQMHMRGTVRYCVYREFGYCVGIEFQAGSEWSRSQSTPKHMLDLEGMGSAQG